MRFGRIAGGALWILFAVYVGDYTMAKAKLANPASGYLETLQIQRYYGVPQKDGRQDFVLDQPQAVKCIHSIFPHFSYNPCWYVKRQNGKEAPMGE